MARAAYRLLVSMLLADGSSAPEERLLLAQYREALGIPYDDELESDEDSPVLSEETRVWRKATHHERAHMLRMLVRVAFADGRMAGRERRLLLRVTNDGRSRLYSRVPTGTPGKGCTHYQYL